MAGGIFYQMHRTVSYGDLNSRVNELIVDNKYDEATAILKSFIKKTSSKQQKANAWGLLGTVYLNQKQYADALQAFSEEGKLTATPTPGMYSAIALTAEKQGDKKTALENYKKALDLAKNQKNARDTNRDVQYLTSRVRALGGTP